MTDGQCSAVVLGASMSGLLAARTLSEQVARVTVVERDALTSDAALRKGVPQAGHAHGLLSSGDRIIEDLFPGIMDELGAAGAPRGDVVGDFLWYQFGHWKLRHQSGLAGITVSRPCFEAAIRRRVKAQPNVAFVEGTSAQGLVFDAAAGRVTGVEVTYKDSGKSATLEADLTVDASGRGSRSPEWLEALGYERPRELAIRVDVGYATRIYERKPGEFFGSTGGIIAATPPHGRRFGAVLAAEGDRWVVTLAGTLGDHPPDDEPGWAAFAASLPESAVHDLISSARPLSEIRSYRFPANRRVLYERMTRLPGGYVVMGDALCSFNPIYGQGMSVAATESVALAASLARGMDGIAQRFYARASKIVDTPWAIATGEDLRYPEVVGKRPHGFGLLSRYMERVHAAASDDPVVCRRFFDVLTLLAPPAALMSPGIVLRVLARSLPKGPGSPWGLAPSTPTS